MNAFARWIERVGLTKHDAALALGLGDPSVWKYCRDDFWPTKHVALRIARFTGGEVLPNDLFDNGGKPFDKSREHRRAQRAISKAIVKRREKLTNAKKKVRVAGAAGGRRPNHQQRPE